MRITPIQTLDDVKRVYKFLTDRFTEESRESYQVPFPLADTYNGMMEQIENKQRLQLKAEKRGLLIGFIAAQDKDKNGRDIYIQCVVVRKQYLKSGIGGTLMRSMEYVLKKAGYAVAKINEYEGSNFFFMKSGFTPYLYISCPNEETAKVVKHHKLSRMDFVEEYEKDGKFVIKFDVLDEPVQQYKKYFTDLGDSIEARYVFEKNLLKK